MQYNLGEGGEVWPFYRTCPADWLVLRYLYSGDRLLFLKILNSYPTLCSGGAEFASQIPRRRMLTEYFERNLVENTSEM